MKKFVTLVLALVMALAIALPAMAFTDSTTAPSNAVPYELDVYLVEYNGEFFGLTSLPPADRGYAKNEIVAAIVELFIPKDKDPNPAYSVLEIDGDNVSFNVTEQPQKTTGAWALVDSDTSTPAIDSWEAAVGSVTAKTTMKWLVFAKVTGDDASITAKLVEGSAPGSLTVGVAKTYTLGGNTYAITKTSSYNYTVKVTSGDYLNAEFKITADKNGKTNGMSIKPDTMAFMPLVPFGGGIGVMTNSSIVTSGSDYNKVMDIYEDVVVGVFGFDFNKIGNYITDSAFTGMTSSKTITATVEIKPWTAYVTVPDNIIVDPPKTGDAASIVGFVMIVLAAAAVVAVKKVRA